MDEDTATGLGTCSIEIEPVTIEAGRTFEITARVVCDPPCDREGERVAIVDEAGEQQGELILGPYDGEGGNPSDTITFDAPTTLGALPWTVVVPACDAEDIHFPQAATDLPVTVSPHAIRVVAWNVPRTAVEGERFTVRLGAKCSGGCTTAGWSLAVSREDGGEPVTIELGDEPSPGTEGLYYADVELRAPAEPGRYRWTASVADIPADMPHESAIVGFGIHCTPAPDCVLEVQAFDRQTQSPIPRATVHMQPYRALTDGAGIARLAVPRGQYRLLVSGSGHFAHRVDLDVTGDHVERAELDQDRELTEADLW